MDQMLYEGKAKQVFKMENPDLYRIHYKDDATAFNGEKKGTIHDKGVLNNKITSFFFTMLNEAGIPTHFVERIDDRDQIVKALDIVPLEVIVRNIAAGSMAKRFGLEEGILSWNFAIRMMTWEIHLPMNPKLQPWDGLHKTS